MACMVYLYIIVFSLSNTISRIFADLSHNNISCGPQSWHFYSDVNVQFYFDTQADLSSPPAKLWIFYRKLVWRKIRRRKAGLAWNGRRQRRVLICIVEAQLTHYLALWDSSQVAVIQSLPCHTVTPEHCHTGTLAQFHFAIQQLIELIIFFIGCIAILTFCPAFFPLNSYLSLWLEFEHSQT